MLYPYPTVYFPGFRSMIFHFFWGIAMKESSIVDFRIRMHLLFLQPWHVHSYMFLLSIPPINSAYGTFTPLKKTMSANYTIDIIVGTVVCLKIHYPKMSWFYGSQEFKPHPEHRRRGGTESCLKLGTSNFHALSLVLCSTICLFWWCYQFWDTFFSTGVSPVECHPSGWICSFWGDSNPLLGGFKFSLPSSSRIDNLMGRFLFSMNYALKRPASGLYIVIVSIYFDSSWWLPWYPTAQFCFGLETTLCHQCFVYFWSCIQLHLSGS